MRFKLRNIFWVVFFTYGILVRSLSAYEVQTHGLITENAFLRSVLNAGYLQNQLAFHSDQTFQGLSARQWLRTGSIREDDYLSGGLFSPDFFRFRNHFWDPHFRRGLTNSIISGNSAYEWALEEQNPISGQNFSWRDARQYFLTGLTAQSPRDRQEALALTFRSIGQIVHLVQDMGSPEHTRNDVHGGLPVLGLGESSLFERRVQERQDQFDYSGYQTPTFNTRQHFWWTNDGTGRGFAEFTNRNFITKSTNFTRTEEGNMGVGNFPSPGLGAYPSPTLRLSPGYRIDQDVSTLPERPLLPGKVTFFGNDVTDTVTRGTTFNPRMTTYSLFDSALRSKGEAEVFTINRYTVDAAATFLLPRAVGYSAGLIDHFFRGKLDVDLFTDETDPSIVRLEGTNGSPDKLDGGILTLYADDTEGNRSALAALDRDFTVIADPVQPITSARFQAQENAERFIAVYKGKLGDEVPQGDFPGGVIGKVLGGVRVEQIFSDGTRWNLRTPKGIYPLPILVEDVKELRWGDNDNTLVGRSALGPGAPNLFYAFEIRRPVGSLEVPLRDSEAPLPDQPSSTQVVDLIDRDPIRFPFGIAAGTTVRLSHTIEYRQLAVTVFRLQTQTWDDVIKQYRLSNVQYSEPQVRPLAEGTKTLTKSYPVVLGLDSYFGTFGPAYFWSVQDIALNSQGQILALVAVRPNVILDVFGEFPFYRVDPPPGDNGNDDLVASLVDRATYFLTYPQNMGPILWALVNVSNGEIVASTAPQNLTINHKTAETEFSSLTGVTSQVFAKSSFVGGPQNGVFKYDALVGFGGGLCTQEERDQMQIIQIGEPIQRGFLQARLDQYRPEIAEHQPLSGASEQESKTRHFITCGDPQFGIPPKGFEMTHRNNSYGTTRVDKASRSKSDSGPNSIVLMMDLYDPHNSVPRVTRGKLLHWTPEQNQAPLRGEFFESGFFGQHSIRSVSRNAVLVNSTFTPSAGGAGFSSLTVVLLEDGPSSIDLQGINPANFIMLNPESLYNVTDLKFYSKQASPQRTALPAILAPGGTVSFNDYQYHAVRVP